MITVFPAMTDALYIKAQEIQRAIKEEKDFSKIVNSIKKPYFCKVERNEDKVIATIFISNLKLITIDNE